MLPAELPGISMDAMLSLVTYLVKRGAGSE